jgi:hypothetical protein
VLVTFSTFVAVYTVLAGVIVFLLRTLVPDVIAGSLTGVGSLVTAIMSGLFIYLVSFLHMGWQVGHQVHLASQYTPVLPVLPRYIVYTLANENSIHEIPNEILQSLRLRDVDHM